MQYHNKSKQDWSHLNFDCSIKHKKNRKIPNSTGWVMAATCEIWSYSTGAGGCPAIDIIEWKIIPKPLSCESPLQVVAFIRHLPAHPALPVLHTLVVAALQGCWTAVCPPAQRSRETLARNEGFPKHRYLLPPFQNTDQSNADFQLWHHRSDSPIPTTCQLNLGWQ